MTEFTIVRNVTRKFSFAIINFIDDTPRLPLTFNITRNVHKNFIIIMPKFIETMSYNGYVYSSADITDTISVNAVSPGGYPENLYDFPLVAPEPAFPTITKTGPVTYTYPEVTINCDILAGVPGRGISYGGPGMWVGTETTGGVVTGRYKTWIPFEIDDIPQGTQIISAIFSFAGILTNGDCNLIVGCDARENSIPPVTYTDLNDIAVTSAYYQANVAQWAAGITYTIDITSSVQEVINYGGWIKTNTIGVIILGDSSTSGYRYIASLEYFLYPQPVLTIIAIMPVPY